MGSFLSLLTSCFSNTKSGENDNETTPLLGESPLPQAQETGNATNTESLVVIYCSGFYKEIVYNTIFNSTTLFW